MGRVSEKGKVDEITLGFKPYYDSVTDEKRKKNTDLFEISLG